MTSLADQYAAKVAKLATTGRSVHERWNAVLARLPGIGKDSQNTQQNFKYRSIDAVLKEAHGLFGEEGVHVVPVAQRPSYGERTTARGTIMVVCYLEVDWKVYGLDGDSFDAQTLGEGVDSGDKATSKAQTMAFKYLLWPTLIVADHEDPDGKAVEDSVSSSVAAAPVPVSAPPARSRTNRPPPGSTEAPSANGDGEVLCDARARSELRRILAPHGKTSDHDVLLSVKTTMTPERQGVSKLEQVTAAEAAAAILVLSGEKVEGS